MLCWFLLYNKVNQLDVYIFPFPLGPPFHHTPQPTSLGHHRAQSWAPCAIRQVPIAVYFTHGSVYMSIPISQFIPPSLPPPCPHVHSLCLHLYSCPANRFICTIFEVSTYMHWYTIFVFLFLTYFTLHSVWQTPDLSTSLQFAFWLKGNVLLWQLNHFCYCSDGIT